MALLLTFSGGYLDAYTWMVHGVMANAQTANLIFLWVYGTAGNWAKALHFGPPILAFAVGVVIASLLRRLCGERAAAISLFVEIILLVVIAVLHNRLPQLAGTLGISVVAALQVSAFTRIEGVPYSSVMITGNLRQAVEYLFAASSKSPEPNAAANAAIFTALCMSFGVGAAVGAVVTQIIPKLSLAIPVLGLLIVLMQCEAARERDDG